MNSKFKNIATVVCFSAIIIALGLTVFLKEPEDILVSERRKAAQFPEFSFSAVMDKSFFNGLENYLSDQFPLRDTFRSLKAKVQFFILKQKDNNGIYTAEGHISELDFRLNEDSVHNAAKKFNSIYEKYISGHNARCYYSVIPDKNYFLAEKNGYPSLDYDRMMEIYCADMKNMTYIDIFGCLDIDDYYKTDSHWKQESIFAVTEKLGKEMGFRPMVQNDYTAEKVADFSGVYAPRLAMKTANDELICMTSPVTESAEVFNLETNKTSIGVYNREKLSGNDKYDVYLSGATALLTVKNPLAKNERELVIFRDSFGSSLTPLILDSYSKITVVDLRYVSSQILGEYVNFENSDVLFIYNTLILNQSSLLK